MSEMQPPSEHPAQGLSKKERRELKRQEKQAQLTRVRQVRAFKKILIWLAILAGIGVLIYSLLNSRPPDYGEPEILAQSYSLQGANHIPVGSSHPPYNSNPPSSGWHYADPADWGYYDNELPDEELIHNLEHGGIWIAYKPDLAPALIKQLEEVSKPYRRRIVMAPRQANDADIALVAWGLVDKFEVAEFSEKRVVDFIKQFIDKGPEKVPF